jgi:hypothetical protein
MSISNDNARKLWNDVFGENVLWGVDCFGIYIYRDDHGVYDKQRIRPNGDGQNHYYGWDVDHIRPKSDFENENDADFWNNYEPMHRSNNEEKADNCPHFEINGRKFKIVKCDICSSNGVKGYGIQDVTTDKRIDWKARNRKYYPE